MTSTFSRPRRSSRDHVDRSLRSSGLGGMRRRNGTPDVADGMERDLPEDDGAASRATIPISAEIRVARAPPRVRGERDRKIVRRRSLWDRGDPRKCVDGFRGRYGGVGAAADRAEEETSLSLQERTRDGGPTGRDKGAVSGTWTNSQPRHRQERTCGDPCTRRPCAAQHRDLRARALGPWLCASRRRIALSPMGIGAPGGRAAAAGRGRRQRICRATRARCAVSSDHGWPKSNLLSIIATGRSFARR